MTAARHDRPAPDVAVGPGRERPGRAEDLARKLGISSRDVDGPPFGNRPWAVHAGVIGPERRADRPGEPIEADIRKQPVARERRFDIPGAVRPSAELLDDPCRETRG